MKFSNLKGFVNVRKGHGIREIFCVVDFFSKQILNGPYFLYYSKEIIKIYPIFAQVLH